MKIYRKAFKRIVTGKNKYCCDAIRAAGVDGYIVIDSFDYYFRPFEEEYGWISHAIWWGAPTKEAQLQRSLALLLMQEIADDET